MLNFPAKFLDDKLNIIMNKLPVIRESCCLTVSSLFNSFLLQSPHITSSSSSSEGDEEEADGEVNQEPQGQQEVLCSANTNSPPPSYSHKQVLKFTLNKLCSSYTGLLFLKREGRKNKRIKGLKNVSLGPLSTVSYYLLVDTSGTEKVVLL